MSPFKDLFDNIKSTSDTEWIYQADDSTKLKVEGVGDIITTVGKLQNVSYVPQLRQNLFSTCSAARRGIFHVGHKKRVEFYRRGSLIFSAISKHDLFFIKIQPLSGHGAGRANAATLRGWHARFGHISNLTIECMSLITL